MCSFRYALRLSLASSQTTYRPAQRGSAAPRVAPRPMSSATSPMSSAMTPMRAARPRMGRWRAARRARTVANPSKAFNKPCVYKIKSKPRLRSSFRFRSRCPFLRGYNPYLAILGVFPFHACHNPKHEIKCPEGAMWSAETLIYIYI